MASTMDAPAGTRRSLVSIASTNATQTAQSESTEVPPYHSTQEDIEKDNTQQNDSDQSTDVPADYPQDIEAGGKDKAQDTEPEETRSIQGWRWFAVCLSVFSTAILYGLDTTIAANIQTNVVETFGVVEKLAWLGTGFSLGSIAIIMFVGKAFGIFNLRTLYLSCLVMFEAGSALCGGAPSMNALIVGRVWAGMGGAGIYLGALNTVAIFTTQKERSIYIGMIALFWGIGCILGPVVGGAFADSAATWRWAFYINLVLCGAISPCYYFMPSFDPQPTKPLAAKLRDLDWVGVILNAAVYITFVMALTFGGAIWQWSSGGIIAFFVAFGVLLIAFALQQTYAIFTTTENRLFPVDFLKRRSLVLLYVLTACTATGLYAAIYFIPVYFQFAHGVDGMTSAVRLLPFIIILVFSVMVNGVFMPLTGWYMPWYLFSGVFLTIGSALMYALMDSHSSNGLIYGISVLLALGTGSACQAAYSIAPAKVDPIRTPDAVGFINSAQIGSITLVGAISGTIFQNIGYNNIAEVVAGLGFSSSDIHSALAGAESALLTDTTPEVQAAVIAAIVNAIRDVYAMAIAAGGLATVASVFLPREKLYMEMAGGG